MRIEELSIGDWVRVDDTPTKVWYLSEDSEVNDTKNDWVEPIPITPEILEKNGFEKGEIYEGNSSIVFTNGNIRISWFKNTMWCRVRIYNALGDIEMCSAIVHNVHQLQHALRLAGVEKEIEV